jgi:hypothetical protein
LGIRLVVQRTNERHLTPSQLKRKGEEQDFRFLSKKNNKTKLGSHSSIGKISTNNESRLQRPSSTLSQTCKEL